MKNVRTLLPVTVAVYALSLIFDVSGIIPFHQVIASPGAPSAITTAAAKSKTGATDRDSDTGATDQKGFQTISKDISLSSLEKYRTIDISVIDPKAEGDDKKETRYSGVSLRTIVSDMVPDLKLESMPEIKTAAKRELVVEVKGADGYPALIPFGDIAINRQGDRFVLVTHRDGKLIESGPQLICKMDEAKTRWVHEVVSLRLVGLRD